MYSFVQKENLFSNKMNINLKYAISKYYKSKQEYFFIVAANTFLRWIKKHFQ